MSIRELAAAFSVPEHDVEAALRASRSVHNVGTRDFPIFTWKVGKNASPKEVWNTVRRLLGERPMSLIHLVAATDLSPARIVAVVKRLHHKLVLYGDMWFLPSG